MGYGGDDRLCNFLRICVLFLNFLKSDFTLFAIFFDSLRFCLIVFLSYRYSLKPLDMTREEGI